MEWKRCNTCNHEWSSHCQDSGVLGVCEYTGCKCKVYEEIKTKCMRCKTGIYDTDSINVYNVGSGPEHYFLCNKCNLQYVKLKECQKDGKISKEFAQEIATDFMNYCFNIGAEWQRAVLQFDDKEAKRIKDEMKTMAAAIFNWSPMRDMRKVKS